MSFRQGARQFFERRGAPTPSVPTARDYVQDGLVAMWDGIENAGWGVHDPNATTWKNLVGTSSGSDFVVTAGHFLDDSLAVTGSNATQQSTSSPIVSNMTFEVSFRVPNVIKSGGPLFVWHYLTEGPLSIATPWNYLRVTGGSNGNYGNDDNSYDLSQYLGTEFNATMVDYVGQNGLWVNGVMARPNFVAQVGDDDRYATVLNTGGQAEVHFHALRVYSKHVSALEIAANCAIDKVRFNLP